MVQKLDFVHSFFLYYVYSVQRKMGCLRFASIATFLVCFSQVSAFQLGNIIIVAQGLHHRQSKCSFSVTCQLDRIEAKAVQKFTTQYEKLCKTCPSRLQPRVDTVIQLIAGLTSVEQEELFSRIDAEGMRAKPSGAPRPEIGDFVEAVVQTNSRSYSDTKPSIYDKQSQDEATEIQRKIAKQKRKLGLTRQLLSVIDTCAEPGFDAAPHIAALAEQVGPEHNDEAQMEFMEELDELRRMPSASRQKRRLKLLEKRAKYERKIFEYQLELEAASCQCAAA